MSDGGNTVPRIVKAEHIGPDDTGDNIEAKRAANYVWNGSSWERQTASGSGGLTDAELRATPVPVSGTVTATPTGTQNVDVTANTIGLATSAKQDLALTQLQTINSLTPAVYDYISLTYTGSNLTGVVFKTGGSGGTTISTLTLAYTGSRLDSVTKT